MDLPSYQHMIIGLIFRAMGPYSNAPIDTITAKILWRAGQIFNAMNYLDCDRHVENGRYPVILQRHHSACATSGAWASYRVHHIWARKQHHRDTGCNFYRRSLLWIIDRSTVYDSPVSIVYSCTTYFFEGNRLILQKKTVLNAYTCFQAYQNMHNLCFWAWPKLWLYADRTILTSVWFIHRLHLFFSRAIASQSMQTGGATALVEASVAPNLIQTAGRWTSNTFNCCVQKNSFLLSPQPTNSLQPATFFWPDFYSLYVLLLLDRLVPLHYSYYWTITLPLLNFFCYLPF